MSLESLNDAKLSMRLLIRAANTDRELLADKGWQDVMMHLNRFLKRYQQHQVEHEPVIQSARKVKHYLTEHLPDVERNGHPVKNP